MTAHASVKDVETACQVKPEAAVVGDWQEWSQGKSVRTSRWTFSKKVWVYVCDSSEEDKCFEIAHGSKACDPCRVTRFGEPLKNFRQ